MKFGFGRPGLQDDARYLDGCRLRLLTDLLLQHRMQCAAAPRKVEHSASVVSAPAIARVPELAAARIVGHLRNVAERPQWLEVFAWRFRRSQKSIKAARLNQVDLRRRDPVSLTVGHGDFAARSGSHAKRMSKAAGQNLQPLAVGAQLQQRAAVRAVARFQEDEAAVGRALQAHRVGMRHPLVDQVVIERFVEVGFAVAVFIVKPS